MVDQARQPARIGLAQIMGVEAFELFGVETRGRAADIGDIEPAGRVLAGAGFDAADFGGAETEAGKQKSASAPIGTATIESSFSFLRRMKTCSRSSIAQESLSGLNRMCVNRQDVADVSTRFLR